MDPSASAGPDRRDDRGDGSDEDEAYGIGDASRRTYFAHERTLLAWWRTGVAAAAVAIGVGSLVPHLSGLPRERFLALGAGYGAVALAFVIGGTLRARQSIRALEHGTSATLSFAGIWVMTVVISVLVVLTVLATF